MKGERGNAVIPTSLAQGAKYGENLYGDQSEKPEYLESEYYIGRQRALLSARINGYCIVQPCPQKQDVASQ